MGLDGSVWEKKKKEKKKEVKHGPNYRSRRKKIEESTVHLRRKNKTK